MKVMIYKNENNGVGVIIPADCGLTIEEIARKDVPIGAVYEIIDKDVLPSAPQEAWRWQD